MSQKGLAPIFIVLILAALIGGYFVYQKQTKPASQPTTQITLPSPSPTDETINWKTYTNQYYSFKYPEGWIIPTTSDAQQRLFPPGVGPEGIGYKIWIVTLDKGRGVDIAAPIGTKIQIANKVFERKTKDVTIDAIKSARVENDVLPDSGTDGLNRSSVKIPFKDKVLYIQLMCGDSEEGDMTCEQYRSVFEQILSTFKFTE